MTSAEHHGMPRENWERLLEATRCSLQHGVSLNALFYLLMNDPQIQGLDGLPPSPPRAATRRWSLGLTHTCKNCWTCPKFCDLCRNNPNKRCEAEGDLAFKHLENAKLETSCGAPLSATLRCAKNLQREQPDGAAGFEKGEARQFYVESSLVSASALEGWLEDEGPGAVVTVDTLRQFEVLSTTSTKDKPAQQLLRKGASNQETSDNLRVRAEFLEGTDSASIDVRVLENSDRRMDANNKYQLLVVLVQKGDDQPVDFVLSNKFQVTTSRALSGWNTHTPCWDTDVGKLDGCGPQTRTNLQDVRKCAWEKGRRYAPPAEGINQVSTAEELLQLYQEMKSWVGVPRTVRNALTPEATVRHAEKLLPKDSRMRIFWPRDSQHGAMYLCQQGQVDLADSSSGVLLTCNMFRDAVSGHDSLRVTLPEGRGAEQSQTMAMLTTQAELAWKQEKHPGWYASKCGKDGSELLDLFRQQGSVNASLELYTHELAGFLGLQASIFPMFQGGAPQLPMLPWGPSPQQPPLQPCPSPQVAEPGSSEAAERMLTVDRSLLEPQHTGLAPANSAAPSAVTQEEVITSPPLTTNELPRCSGNLYGQSVQPRGREFGYVAQATMPSTFTDFHSTDPNIMPTFSNLNNQGISNYTASTSPGEMPCLPSSAATSPGSAQPLLVAAELGQQSWTGYGFGQHISHPAGMLQPQQPPSSSMQQDVQALEQGPVAGFMCPGSVPGSVVPRGCPTPPRFTEERCSQSHTERSRSRQLLLSNSSKDLEPVQKRRHTAPADMGQALEQALEQAYQEICSQDPSASPLHAGNQASPPGPGALIPVPMGSSNPESHQAQTADASASSYHSIVPALSPLPSRIERSLSQRSWQFCGSDPSSELEFGIFNQLNHQVDVMSWLSNGGLADEGDSQQQVAGKDQVEKIVDLRGHRVQSVVELVLARFWRALVVRRQRHQHALESSNGLWRRAVRAALCNGGRAGALEGTHAMKFANRGSPVDFWGDRVATHEGDDLLNISVDDVDDVMNMLLS